jgi:hypothetical protein
MNEADVQVTDDDAFDLVIGITEGRLREIPVIANVLASSRSGLRAVEAPQIPLGLAVRG